MANTSVTCSNCGRTWSAGTRYCPHCGEAVDPELVRELQWLYGAMQDLEKRIGQGEGAQPITSLYDTYLARYQGMRKAPTTQAKVAPATPTPTASPVPSWLSPAPIPAQQIQNSLASAPAPTPSGPAFSWSAFFAEQAIAILAYLGGFLLLVATLTFEISPLTLDIGNLQLLSNTGKLTIVGVVYLAFAALGLGLYRSERLRTVGRVYLGVFALMTPLVALAIYLFVLNGLGFPAAGMLSLSSLYAVIVYLALALRTRFFGYAALGWVALVVATLAIIPWLDAPQEWWPFALGAVSLVLLAPRKVKLFEIDTLLGEVATTVSAIGAIIAVIGAATLGVQIWYAITSSYLPLYHPSRAAFAFATVVLLGLSLAWSLTLRDRTPRLNAEQIAIADWFVAAMVAEVVVAIALNADADRFGLAIALGITGLAEMGGAIALRQRSIGPNGLRYGVETLALSLAILGWFNVIAEPATSWALVVTLGANAAITAAIAFTEKQRWWLLVSGFFLSYGYQAAVVLTLKAIPQQTTPSNEQAFQMLFNFQTGLALAIWIFALVAGLRETTRPYAAPAYLVALGNALTITWATLLGSHDTHYQTIILSIFAVTALIGAWREQRPGSALASGFFGVLAVLPLSFTESHGVPIALTAIVPAVVTLGVRVFMGRSWIAAPAVVSVWATILATIHLSYRNVDTANDSLLGVPFIAWFLLTMAVLATVEAIIDDSEAVMGLPALLALGAIAFTRDYAAGIGLTLVLVALGVAFRLIGKPQWNVAWRFAAFIGSFIAIAQITSPVESAAYVRALLFVGFGVIATLSAAHEQRPMLTVATPVYLAFAALALPIHTTSAIESFNLDGFGTWPVLAILAGAVLAGAVLRLRVGAEWANAWYVSAVIASFVALLNTSFVAPDHVEALWLIFAGVAYLVAGIERSPFAAIAPAFYATGAAIAQPDPHANLPLALIFSVLGLVVGRVGGWRWSWPLYAVAAVASTATAIRGQTEPGFEALALVAIALVAYIIAAVESFPEVLPVALVLGFLSSGVAVQFYHLPSWQAVLAFMGLSYLYSALQLLWRVIPWLRERPETMNIAWGRDPRVVGMQVHRWGSVILGSGATIGALFLEQSFTPHAVETMTILVALVALAGMLAIYARFIPNQALWYVAGGLMALAVTWGARWLGADNAQAYIIAPGSYLILIGALLPVDKALGQPVRAGQFASIWGAIVLMVPSLTQSFLGDSDWVYALTLAIEALVITGIGVGTRSRLLLLTGVSFVGLAAIRGAVIAVNSGLPIALVIGLLAVLLMGGATWLSLRARQQPLASQGGDPPPSPPSPQEGVPQP